MSITGTPVSTATLRKCLKDVLNGARLKGESFEVRTHDRVAADIVSPENMALLERTKRKVELAGRPAPTLELVRAKASELNRALADLGTKNLSVFGSVARGDATSASDLALDTGLFARKLRPSRFPGTPLMWFGAKD